MSDEKPIELRACPRIREVPREQWDALLRPGDNPFVSWSFLEALEASGCVRPQRHWWSCHLTAWRGGRLIAAAPAYVKVDGAGDFSRDWSFGHALEQLGGSLYPKLIVGVPFTPVPGRRLLHSEALTGLDAAALLTELARSLAAENDLQTIQVLYHLEEERTGLEAVGFAPRALVQYHWHNLGYTTFDDWLADLPSKKRTQIRRERREPATQEISLRTARGYEIAEDPKRWADIAYGLYETTCDKYMWGGTYLNRDFFRRLFRSLPRTVELALAERAGDIVAGAVNLATPSHLYGRYWGCFEEHRFLHFNVCQYHGVEQCIGRGLQVFEGGAGGEHKLARGFLPRIVHSSLWFRDQKVQALLGDALRRDFERREAEVEEYRQERT